MFERKSGDIEAHRERDQRVPNQNCHDISRWRRGWIFRFSLIGGGGSRVAIRERSGKSTLPSVQDSRTRSRFIIPSTQGHKHTATHENTASIN